MEHHDSPYWKKLLWLVVIWSASVLALGAVSMVLRLLMSAAGLKRINLPSGQPLRWPCFVHVPFSQRRLNHGLFSRPGIATVF